MDRDDLLRLVDEMDDGARVVGTDGDLWSEDDYWSVSDVEEQLEALADSLTKLRKVVAWAKLAPMYVPPKPTHTNESGVLCEADGTPI